MNADLLRNSMKLGVATLLTAALAVHFDRLAYAWYPLLAVLIVVDDNDDHTIQAASGRILGTMAGCLITFAVHSIASGWLAVSLSLLLMIPLLRLMGWQSAIGTAGLMPIVFLMIPDPAPLKWHDAFNRALDTAVGCGVGLAVGLLFWPRYGLTQLVATEESLIRMLAVQAEAYRRWLKGAAPRPQPLPPAPLSAGLERMETLLRQELAGPLWRQRRASDWCQKLALWQRLRLHWVQWERLLAASDGSASDGSDPPPAGPNPIRVGIEALATCWLEGTPVPPPDPPLESWSELAQRSGRPLLTLLALAQEQHPLLASSHQLIDLRGAAPWR
jgi:hypothetical protein